MSQHLYPCEHCGAHGVAHYVLEPQADPWAPFRLVCLCTKCWKLLRKVA